MRTIFTCFSLLLCFLIISCGDSGKKDKVNIDELEGRIGYVKPDDADSILPEWGTNNMVVAHTVAEVDNLHPTNGATTSRSWVLQYTMNFILRSDLLTMDVAPELAMALPEISEDKLSYTYTLRKECKWDDGSPITAEDCIFMLKANMCPLTNNQMLKPYFENIADLISYPEDKYKFTIVMHEEQINNINFLTDFPVIQRKFYDPEDLLSNYTCKQFHDTAFNAGADLKLSAWANTFNDPKNGSDLSMLNGSGPYRVATWEPGNLILERKKNHWTQTLAEQTVYEASFPEKIVFRLVQDPNAQMLEMRAQTLDVTSWLPTPIALELMAEAEFNKNYNIRFTDNFSYNYAGMNMRPDGINRKKFFDDVRVRRAMALLAPVDEIIQVLAQGYAKRQATMVSPLKKQYNDKLPLLAYDVEAAKKLLDEAGWKDTDGDNIRDKMIDGVKTDMIIELKYPSGQKFVEDMVAILSESAYKAGIKLMGAPVEFRAMREQLAAHDFDMFLSALSGTSSTEDYAQLWHTNAYKQGGSNYVGFGNAESDALIDSIKHTVDEAARIPMELKLQEIVYNEQPFIFLYSTAKKNVIHKRFGNQYMTFERPNVILNNLRLLSLYGPAAGATQKAESMQ